MITLESALYLRIEQLFGGPTPLPLASGFSVNTAYRALGLYNPSETSDAYFVFANDRDEIWFICNRHLRAIGLLQGQSAMRMPLARAQSLAAKAAA
jgi:hypothetical protein